MRTDVAVAQLRKPNVHELHGRDILNYSQWGNWFPISAQPMQCNAEKAWQIFRYRPHWRPCRRDASVDRYLANPPLQPEGPKADFLVTREPSSLTAFALMVRPG